MEKEYVNIPKEKVGGKGGGEGDPRVHLGSWYSLSRPVWSQP